MQAVIRFHARVVACIPTVGLLRPATIASTPRCVYMSTYSPPASSVKELRTRTQAAMLDCVKALQHSNGEMEGAIDFLRKKGMASASAKAGRTAAQGVIAAAVNEGSSHAAIIELNSETDFVSRNSAFTTLATGIARHALSTCTPPAAFTLEAPTGVPTLSSAAMANLNASTMPATGVTVSNAVASAIGVIGENLILRRVALLPRLDPANSHVAAYLHNSSVPGVGSVAVLLALTVTGGAGTGVPQPLRSLAHKLAMHVAAAKPAYLSRAHVPPAAIERERAVLEAQAAGSGKPANILARMVEGRIAKFYGETVLLEQPFILSEDGKVISKMLVEAAKANGVAKLEIAGFAHFITGETQQAPAAAPAAS